MATEVLEYLTDVPAGLYIDGTLGGGGHAALLLEARPDCELLGIDRDGDAIKAATEHLARFGDRVQIVHGGFESVGDITGQLGIGEGNVTGMLLDLGVSSPQLDRPERGFSYRFDAPLDMRMDAKQTLTAADVVNNYSESDLADVIARYGEERFARRVARRIVENRPVLNTRELVDLIRAAIPAATRRKGGHPARRTFQAIRMEVNRELPNLAAGLDESVHLLAPEGRMVVIAYHSLEDRMVKEKFTEAAGRGPQPYPLPPVSNERPTLRLLTRKPRRPTDEEVAENPRAESAKLRAVQRLPLT
jgi:16S rRNA (cytosine1402-N4)-methyltransferase